MGKAIKGRAPLTREEVLAYLNYHVENQARQWGENNFYTEWARKTRDERLAEFDEGITIAVWSVEYCDSYGNGTGSFRDILYSDGSVTTECYGYYD